MFKNTPKWAATAGRILGEYNIYIIAFLSYILLRYMELEFLSSHGLASSILFFARIGLVIRALHDNGFMSMRIFRRADKENYPIRVGTIMIFSLFIIAYPQFSLVGFMFILLSLFFWTKQKNS